MVNNKIEILARIFYDLKGMENYRGLRFRLSSEEVILVRSYFFKYGLSYKCL